MRISDWSSDVCSSDLGADGPAQRWRALRDEVHAEVCRDGWDPARRTFTQSYGSTELDASLLMIPMVGFLPPDDERVVGTIEAVQRELSVDGLDRKSTRLNSSH